ncbi:MAG: hypothetical protein Ct9H300mP14_14970 [Gammaproteobacteria bacterium]|nr:MAG: hypothetical protein Ct9H300mP14_14970 [Gammaproteobacteria bacterium]
MLAVRKSRLGDLDGAETAGSSLRWPGERPWALCRKGRSPSSFRRLRPARSNRFYVSNAGVLMTDEPSWEAAGATDANWQLAFEVT